MSYNQQYSNTQCIVVPQVALVVLDKFFLLLLLVHPHLALPNSEQRERQLLGHLHDAQHCSHDSRPSLTHAHQKNRKKNKQKTELSLEEYSVAYRNDQVGDVSTEGAGPVIIAETERSVLTSVSTDKLNVDETRNCT